MAGRAHELSPGFVFAQEFRVLEKIGEGGMGVVYAVEQLSTRKRRALKLMHAGLMHDVRLRERFLQEAHAGAELESDHIVEVVGAGIDPETGEPWLAMELLRGETLEQRVSKTGPLAPKEVLELATQMRHVLAQAHATGLVHRDLKPDNLFICHARRVGIPFTLKVLDFGIAKWLQETRSATNSQVIGSPLWMAPEQWQPSAPISPPTDVWAVALVMFFAVTGRVYWRAAETDDIGRIVVEVVSDPLDPPSVRARKLGSGVQLPPPFDEWFLACLNRDPRRRPENADVALGRIEPILGGRTSSLAPARDSLLDESSAPTVAVRPGMISAEPAPASEVIARETFWSSVSSPLEPHHRVQRVLEALAPVIAGELALEPVLVGLTEDLRLGRIAALPSTADSRTYERAARVVEDVSRRLSIPAPPIYARSNQKEPLRVEPTAPLAYVFGPALGELSPSAAAFLCASTAAVARPELWLRALAPGVTELRRIVTGATEIARNRNAKVQGALLLSVLRDGIVANEELARCLDEHGEACTEDALVEWFSAVDCTLARIGLVATGQRESVSEAWAARSPFVVPPALPVAVADLDDWAGSGEHTRARAAWTVQLAH